MRNKLIVLAAILVSVLAMAQTFAPPSIGSDGPIATSPSQCPVSAAHGFSICPVETGAGTGALYVSINGSAPALLQGAPGPQGPTGPVGPAGATGAQGPPGPVQSFGTAKCPIWSNNNGSITLGPGCAETTP